jgi:putative flippase GtrA
MNDEVESETSGAAQDADGVSATTGGISRVEALKSRTRLGKFISVGLFGAACDTTVFLILVEVFGVLAEVAVLAGIETAIIIMFLINDHWTFADEGMEGRRSIFSRLLKSNAVRAVGTLTHFLVFVIVFRLLFVDISLFGIGLWGVVAKGLGIVTGGAVNYVAESLFTWRVHKDL